LLKLAFVAAYQCPLPHLPCWDGCGTFSVGLCLLQQVLPLMMGGFYAWVGSCPVLGWLDASLPHHLCW
jgi:hypothetical protein